MTIDTSFGPQQDDGIEDNDTGKNSLTQDQGDYDITRPVAILESADDASSGAAQEKAVDPYDNGYWTKLPLQ